MSPTSLPIRAILVAASIGALCGGAQGQKLFQIGAPAGFSDVVLLRTPGGITVSSNAPFAGSSPDVITYFDTPAGPWRPAFEGSFVAFSDHVIAFTQLENGATRLEARAITTGPELAPEVGAALSSIDLSAEFNFWVTPSSEVHCSNGLLYSWSGSEFLVRPSPFAPLSSNSVGDNWAVSQAGVFRFLNGSWTLSPESPSGLSPLSTYGIHNGDFLPGSFVSAEPGTGLFGEPASELSVWTILTAIVTFKPITWLSLDAPLPVPIPSNPFTSSVQLEGSGGVLNTGTAGFQAFTFNFVPLLNVFQIILIETYQPSDREDIRWSFFDESGSRSTYQVVSELEFQNTLASLVGTPSTVPASGGIQSLTIQGQEAHSGAEVVILGSASGGSPGTPYAGSVIPLNLDAYTNYHLLSLGSSNVVPQVFNLDQDSRGVALVAIPVVDAALIGLEVSHLALLFDQGAPELSAESRYLGFAGPSGLTIGAP